MIKIKNVLVAIADGVTKDRYGEILHPGSLTFKQDLVPATDAKGLLIGEAELISNSGAIQHLGCNLAISDLAMTPQQAAASTPSITGKVIRRSLGDLFEVEITGVMLSALGNADARITSLAKQGVQVLVKQSDGSWKPYQCASFSGYYSLGYKIERMPPPIIRPTCQNCARELSKTMDAYYGKNPAGGVHCVDCRTKLRIS